MWTQQIKLTRRREDAKEEGMFIEGIETLRGFAPSREMVHHAKARVEAMAR